MKCAILFVLALLTSASRADAPAAFVTWLERNTAVAEAMVNVSRIYGDPMYYYFLGRREALYEVRNLFSHGPQ